MFAVFSALLILALSVVIVRLATVGLTMTGLSRDLAQFQALSAFTGSGFTTREAEEIVNHPLRRRIVMHLMLLGNAGVIAGVTTLMLSFLNTSNDDHWMTRGSTRLGILSVGVVLLLLIANSKYLEMIIWNLTSWGLEKWANIHVHDYTRLLRLAGDFVVSELHVHPDDWLAGQTLSRLRLASEGVLVLGIEKSNGDYLGAPRGDSEVDAGDVLVLYGRQEVLLNLDARRAGMEGNVQHVMSVTRHFDSREEEEQPEP